MSDNNSSNKGLITTFFIASFMLAAFSGYQTFRGYESSATTIGAVVIGLIAGFFIFYLTFEFISRRVRGNKTTPSIIIALLVIVVISFPANFNSLYTYFTKERGNLVELKINSAWTVFDGNMKKAKEALGRIPEANLIQEKFNQIQSERNNLHKQITDPNNLGLGKKAQEHLRKIESLLGQSITRLSSPRTGSDIGEYETYANDMDTLIGKVIDTKFRDDDKYGKVVAEVNTNHQAFEDTVRKNNSDASIIIKMARASEEIQNSLKSIGVNIYFEPIHTESVGEIPGTFTTAFVEMPQPKTTFFVTLLSLAIDLLLPLLGVLIFSPGDTFGSSKDSDRHRPTVL